MQIVGRERAAVLLQHIGRRLDRAVPRVHPALPRQAVALPQIAGAAGGHDVGPNGAPAAGARHEVIEGQLVRGVGLAAILAGKAIAQEDVEAGERRVAGGGHVFLQRNDARQLHLQRGAAHADIVMIDDVDAVEEHRLDRVLPGP